MGIIPIEYNVYLSKKIKQKNSSIKLGKLCARSFNCVEKFYTDDKTDFVCFMSSELNFIYNLNEDYYKQLKNTIIDISQL